MFPEDVAVEDLHRRKLHADQALAQGAIDLDCRREVR
jgi:hypothetical protein